MQLPYNPEELKRELKRYYISATSDDIKQMQSALNIKQMSDLYNHIEDDVKMDLEESLEDGLQYDELQAHLEELAQKNKIMTCFIGDGLHHYEVPSCVGEIANIRGLTTAYTPYQPERSQGTLIGQWLYASSIANITGFEAINTSLYDRSTALFEALKTGVRLKRKANTVLVSKNIQPQDISVINTLALHTQLKIQYIPTDAKTGLTDIQKTQEMINTLGTDLAAIAFAQVTNLGLLENVHALTDLTSENKLCSIAIVDPILMGEGGLIPPSQFGSNAQGATMFVAEGQQMMSAPNFGGPGLGIFGIRFNKQEKNSIRNTPGRYVGKAKDILGKEAYCMVLSTREQHIRREKATSNICSNQAFASTLCGASLLQRGALGLKEIALTVRSRAHNIANQLTALDGVDLAFNTAFYNQFTLKVASETKTLINTALNSNLEIGIDVSERIADGNNYLQIFINDSHTDNELESLVDFFKTNFPTGSSSVLPQINDNLIRKQGFALASFDHDTLVNYYKQLGKLNLSPDDNLYPLGSCTMKYNPYINDYAANLKGFTCKHPQSPEQNIQGCLELQYNIQEQFKKITGLHSVVTQAVAGAQGELAGIKMFQAYHEANGEHAQRQIIILPRSAHGTNPASAAMAGYETKKIDGIDYGIITVEANDLGEIDLPGLKEVIRKYDDRIAGIMITNPNTSGIFESHFKEIASLIHEVGGLMYMDGANMNAIAGHVDLGKLGVDAVHNNLHKTWSISHGGGGPGDAIVAVSEKLAPFIVGQQIEKNGNAYRVTRSSNSIGDFHRHFGNFAHKVRGYTYLMALGGKGIKQMSSVAVLSARYLFKQLTDSYPTLPANTQDVPRMHEFILTLEEELFDRLQKEGFGKAQIIPQIGKLFLDFGIHAPTVAFPEPFGLMVEPTESFSKAELDKFVLVVKAIKNLVVEYSHVLKTTPHFSAVKKVDEVTANKNLELSQELNSLPILPENSYSALDLQNKNIDEICQNIIKASLEELNS